MRAFTLAVVVSVLAAGPALAHDEAKVPTREAVAKKAAAESRSAQRGPIKHSGGTDSKGCHTNHKTGDYHCHNPK